MRFHSARGWQTPLVRHPGQCTGTGEVLLGPARTTESADVHHSRLTKPFCLDLDCELRPCCNAALCRACFRKAAQAARTLLAWLPNDGHLMVFSGRRGIHLYVFGLCLDASERIKLARACKERVPAVDVQNSAIRHCTKAPLGVHRATGLRRLVISCDQAVPPEIQFDEAVLKK